jgi:DNA-binding MarR family transcriptional regulator
VEPALRGRGLVTAAPDRAARAPDDVDGKLAGALERIGQALRLVLGERARAEGLTSTQAQLLLRLATAPPPRRQVGALAAEFDLTQATVSDAAAALRRKRLVRFGERPADRRGRPLELTADGSRTAGRLADWKHPLAAALAEAPRERREATLALLLDVIAALQRAGVVTVARMCTTCRYFRPGMHPGTAAPHHCALLDAPLPESELRVDCREHELAA